VVTIPYEQEHSCRLENPDKYERFARVNCYKKSDGKCIDYIFGIKKGDAEAQALRYRTNIWTERDARKHCREKGGTFEPAKKEIKKEEKKMMMKAIFHCDVEKDAEDTYVFVGSDETLDRDSEIIKMSGWKLENYNNKNPIILWGHRHDIPGIGTAKAYKHGEKLKFKVKFAEPGTYDLADVVRRLVDQKILRAVSVGYIPLKREYAKDEPKDGEPRMITTEAELYELSLVNVGANPNAIIELKSIEEKTKKIQYMEEKKVIPYKETPKAPEGEDWDAAAEVRNADVDDLKIMCAWYDSENPDVKSSYKLPHHKAGGKHPVVWGGVAAAMAALLGARGGVQIPENDKKGVYNHLAKHYKEFDKDVPDFKSIDEMVLDMIEEIKKLRKEIQNNTEKYKSGLYSTILAGREADKPQKKQGGFFRRERKLGSIFEFKEDKNNGYFQDD